MDYQHKEFQVNQKNLNVNLKTISTSIEKIKGKGGHSGLVSSNTISQIFNSESIMKVFVSDKEDLNAKNEVRVK